jgi:UDP-N-acetylmuramoylalanine--D-glutamate ligase
MDVSQYFLGKKVTLMRIGLLGRGVGDAAFLAKSGADVLVVDAASQEVMQPSVDALKEFPNIRFKFGAYDLNDFRTCDMVLKGAGTPADSPEIAEAHAHGIPVRMSADLFAELSGLQIFGITGTRGKSTTTHMLYAILKEAGKNVLLGGNVRGVSTLALLDEAHGAEGAVLELDSWQLQGFGEAKISPSIAVFTTFFPDHLNYYHNDLDAYLADKANIFLYQKPKDTLVLGKQCAELIQKKYGAQIQSKLILADATDLPADWILQIPGEHNRYDAALALAAARASGIPDAVSRAALESFTGVPGRLELIRTLDGVAYYNDTNATTPDATLAAIRALQQDREGKGAGEPGENGTLLIMGGADKGIEMGDLIQELTDSNSSVKQVILLAGTGTERIRSLLPDAEVFDNLAMAVTDAKAHADAGDAILLSPAFASFGMFTNEYDRGERFDTLVKAL